MGVGAGENGAAGRRQKPVETGWRLIEQKNKQAAAALGGQAEFAETFELELFR